MPFHTTKIEDVLLFEPVIYGDDRGYFYESYNQKTFAEAGIHANFVQDNRSYSKYGTIRGLHFQKNEHAQAKLVTVLQGKILDVVVDLRHNSKTYGQHVAVELDADDKQHFFVPRGCAHGFSVLSETALFSYKCDNFYNLESEGGIAFDDPDLNIDWRVEKDAQIISDKDLNNMTFDEYKADPCF